MSNFSASVILVIVVIGHYMLFLSIVFHLLSFFYVDNLATLTGILDFKNALVLLFFYSLFQIHVLVMNIGIHFLIQ